VKICLTGLTKEIFSSENIIYVTQASSRRPIDNQSRIELRQGQIYSLAAPRESLITQGTSRGQIYQTIPEYFLLFVRLRASKTEEDAAKSCPMGLSGEIVGLTCSSLTVLNPDFGG
jgi:hypothetical protein